MTPADQQAGPLLALLRAARGGVDRRRNAFAALWGLRLGLWVLPAVGAVLALGFWLLASARGAAPFEPWLLPLFPVLVPVLAGLAFLLQARAQPSSLYEVAMVLDHNAATRDRLSTAVEFLDGRAEFANPRQQALAALAVADGIAAAAAVDPRRTEFDQPAPRWPLARAFLGIALACIPALLPAAQAGADGSPEPPAVAARDSETEESANDDEARERPAGDERADEPSPRPGAASGRAGEPQGSAGEASDAARAGGESGDGGSEQESAATGRDGGEGGSGGAGASSKSTPRSDGAPRSQPRRHPDASRPAQTDRGADADSSTTPSGASSSRGRMTSVGNERAGLDRGSDPAEDADTEEDEIEDEEEESEQRGGIVPSTRDRRQAASRELSISGDGPPDDGRGGPTPPKKARGTASLILGVRLPDRIRGQPNPGTAKTTVERTAPRAGDHGPAPAAAVTGEPSASPQTPAADTRAFAALIRRYHELLRARAANGERR